MSALHPLAIASQAAAEITSRIGSAPDVAVVLGSGWNEAAQDIGDEIAAFSMGSVTGFPIPSVPGHRGRLRASLVCGHVVLWLAGRSHVYEGRTAAEIAHGVRASILAGARTVVLTNAAGAVNPLLEHGHPVLIRDHLNLTGKSPLTGPEPPAGFPSRFADMSDVYSAELRDIARTVAPDLAEGVYAAMAGPQYETPAEITMLRALGADLAGMSTVLEAIAARHLGASVLALSLVTNLAAGVSPHPLDHQEVLAAGRSAVPILSDLLQKLVPALGK